MKVTFYRIKILLFLPLIFGCIFGSQLHVDIHDPIYYYLDRLATQGALPAYMNGTLPLTRDYIAEMLIHLNENRDKLLTVDIKILDEYLADYSYDLKINLIFSLEREKQYLTPFSHGRN